MSLSHRHRHKCAVATLLLSADLNETGGNDEERDEVFPPLRRKMTHRWSCRSSHNSLQLASSLSMYYGIPVLSAIVCVECVRVCIVEAFIVIIQGG